MSFRKRRQKPTRTPEAVSRTVTPEETAVSSPKRLLSYRVANMQGIGARERQEDSFAFVNAVDVTAIREKGLFAAVADGMGGLQDGRLASETALAGVRADFQSMDRGSNIALQLVASVLRAGTEVYRALGGDGGSTMVACVFFRERLYYCSVGDSCLFLLRDGELLRLNREHNVLTERYREMVRSGGMDPEPARNDPEQAALSQFLGMDALDEADFLRRPLKLHGGDRFLLCSDGVGGVLADNEIRACLELDSPGEACVALERGVTMANNPYQDNYTALVIYCGY